MITSTIELIVFPMTLAVLAFLIPLASFAEGIAIAQIGSREPRKPSSTLRVLATIFVFPSSLISKSLFHLMGKQHTAPGAVLLFVVLGVNSALWGLAAFVILRLL